MSFYKELQPFVEYVQSIRKLKNYLSFDIKFPSKWSIPKSYLEDGQSVAFEPDDSNHRGISFVSAFDEVSIEQTISKITKVIKINKEKELKEKLFKQVIDQLKNTFESNDIEKLKGLYFDFDNEIPNLNDDEQDGSESASIELAQ